MTSSSPVRMAVAGLTHGHVTWILRRWQRDDVDTVAFCEPDQALAERYAREFALPRERLFTDLDAMLDTVRPEAVCAFGSIHEHLRVVEACAPRGIHVMVEKPLAVSGRHAHRMAALARAAGVHLITNYETTWYATTYAARYWAEAPEGIGPLRKVVVHDGHSGPVEIGCNAEFLAWLTDPVLNGGGAVVDIGCYGANLMTWLMNGAEPETVTAVLQNHKPTTYPRVDDEATLILTYPQAQAIIQGSWNWPFDRKDMALYGRDGYVATIDDRSLRLRLRGEPTERQIELPPQPLPVSDPFAYFAAVVRGQERVTSGNLWSLENALSVVRILDAARESAREGRTIKLTPGQTA